MSYMILCLTSITCFNIDSNNGFTEQLLETVATVLITVQSSTTVSVDLLEVGPPYTGLQTTPK